MKRLFIEKLFIVFLVLIGTIISVYIFMAIKFVYDEDLRKEAFELYKKEIDLRVEIIDIESRLRSVDFREYFRSLDEDSKEIWLARIDSIIFDIKESYNITTDELAEFKKHYKKYRMFFKICPPADICGFSYYLKYEIVLSSAEAANKRYLNFIDLADHYKDHYKIYFCS